MNLDKKIEYFSGLVLKNAESKREALEANVRQEAEKSVQAYRENAEAEAESRFTVEEQKLRNQKNAALNKATAEGKKKLIALKSKLNKILFDNVQARISEYIKSDDYQSYLVKEIVKLKKYGTPQIYIMKRDMPIVQKMEGFSFIPTDENFYGGFKALVNQRMLIDNTFKSKLEKEQAETYFFNR